LAISLLLLPGITGGLQAQTAESQAVDEAATQETETVPFIPDILDLPADWLNLLEQLDINVELIREGVDRVVTMANRRIAGLEGERLVEAEAALLDLTNSAAALEAAYRKEPDLREDVIPSKDEYTLPELFELRALWREITALADDKRETQAQQDRRSQALRERYQGLVQEYNDADRNTPARIVTGLQRMSTGAELLTIARTTNDLNAEITRLQASLDEIRERFEYAQANAVAGDLEVDNFDELIGAARERRTEFGEFRSILQDQLLEIQGQDEPFRLLKLKQQLALTLAREENLSLEIELTRLKQTWTQLMRDDLGSVDGFQQRKARNNERVSQTMILEESWTRASQATLVSPAPPRSQRGQTRDYSEAQTAAKESLDVIKRTSEIADDIEFLHSLIENEILERGIATPMVKFRLMAEKTWLMVTKVTAFELAKIGDTSLTIGSIVQFFLIITIGMLVSWFVRRVLARLQKRRNLETDTASFYTLGRILHYLIVMIAVLAAFTALGLDTGSLALVAGALSVGIGFGMQSIVANFMSGLILLFEGSLRVGDYVELDSGVRGTVQEIRTRFTRINTNDNVDIVVPNSELVSFKVTNWTLREPVVRIRIPFGVAYGSEKELVRKAALEAIADVPYTISNTPSRQPLVLLTNFGESSLDFEIRVWIRRNGVKRPGRVTATYLWALETRLREHGIEIPFPQRDLHLKNGSLDLRPPVETSNDDK
jgi:small-conductance mechanosensitive channel